MNQKNASNFVRTEVEHGNSLKRKGKSHDIVDNPVLFHTIPIDGIFLNIYEH